MDVSHELGALRFVVDSPLSSKVAMFNQQVDQHKQSQLLNPFSHTDGRASPKPTFSKDEYGKPLAGSLTEMRGQKANIHVLKEMLELCQIIDSEGYNVKDEPTMRVIPFGELFNIYNYISDKVVGILLRARKHKLVEFEGEMLFQRRDDDVPIFLIKPIHEIRREMEDKIQSIKRCGSPAPQATSVPLDKKVHGLDVPRGASPRSSKSRTPSPQTSKSGTPVRDTKAKSAATENSASTKIDKSNDTAEIAKTEIVENKQIETNKSAEEIQAPKQNLAEQKKDETKPINTEYLSSEQQSTIQDIQTNSNTVATPIVETKINEQVQSSTAETSTTTNEIKTDINNNSKNVNNDLLSIVIEANEAYERTVETQETSEANNSLPTPQSDNANSTLPSEPSASG